MSDVQRSSNELALERTNWALNRTIMGLDRTLMALVRTAVSLIGFGFTIYKFLEALKGKSDVAIRPNAPRNLGLFLILLGMALLVVGIFQYQTLKKKFLGEAKPEFKVSLAIVTAVGVFVVGFFALLNIFFGFGGI